MSCDGGIASVARSVARALDDATVTGLLKRVDRVLVNDYPTHPPPPPKRGIQLLEGGSKVRSVWDLWRMLTRRQHDLFIFDHLSVARSMTFPLFSAPPQGYVILVHGTELDSVKEGNRWHRSLSRASRIVANSQFTANRVRHLVPKRADHVCEVPLCVEPDRTTRWEAQLSGAATVCREPVAMIVGRMWAEERGKGHDEVIEAWPRVLARVPNARLWIVGDGNDRSRYQAKVQRCGLGDVIEFLGRVDDGELSRRYRRASVLVMPSRQEGFGLVYAEAMWHELPCIASRADAANELIKDHETGRLVAYGDVEAIAHRIADLIEDPDLVQRMGKAARRRVLALYNYPRFKQDLFKALNLSSAEECRTPEHEAQWPLLSTESKP